MELVHEAKVSTIEKTGHPCLSIFGILLVFFFVLFVCRVDFVCVRIGMCMHTPIIEVRRHAIGIELSKNERKDERLK